MIKFRKSRLPGHVQTKQRLAEVRKAEIDQMKRKQLEFREIMDKEDEEENRRNEEKKKQIWAELHERRAQEKARLEEEVREKAARQEAYRVATEQREAEALDKRQREAARIKTVIQKREADHQVLHSNGTELCVNGGCHDKS